MYKAQLILLIYDFVNKTLPCSLVGLFHGDIHEPDTRHRNDPKPPKVKLDVMTFPLYRTYHMDDSG